MRLAAPAADQIQITARAAQSRTAAGVAGWPRDWRRAGRGLTFLEGELGMDRATNRQGAMTDLYDTDILAWSEHQAALLRRRAAGELVNEGDLDWPNLAEEIESVGSEQLHAVESLLVQILLHRLKAEAWPDSSDVSHWRREMRVFQRQLRRRFAPSMRQKLDLPDLYQDALLLLPDSIGGQALLPVPQVCPVVLDELLIGP